MIELLAFVILDIAGVVEALTWIALQLLSVTRIAAGKNPCWALDGIRVSPIRRPHFLAGGDDQALVGLAVLRHDW